jgi:hypothetical protein
VRRQYAGAAVRGELTRHAEQRRLAPPGLALDHDQPTAPGRRGVERGDERVTLALALQQSLADHRQLAPILRPTTAMHTPPAAHPPAARAQTDGKAERVIRTMLAGDVEDGVTDRRANGSGLAGGRAFECLANGAPRWTL